MEGAKRISLGARKSVKRKRKKNRRLVRDIVAYLKSDVYLFAPLFSNSPPQIQTPPPSNSGSSEADDLSVASGFEALGMESVKKGRRRMSEKVKEYLLQSDYHMYGPIISTTKLGSSLKGKLQITNLVTREVSTSTTTMREDLDYNNCGNLRSDMAEQTLHNGRIKSPKRALVILEEQRTGQSPETDLSPAFSSLPAEEKTVKPDQRRVPIE